MNKITNIYALQDNHTGLYLHYNCHKNSYQTMDLNDLKMHDFYPSNNKEDIFSKWMKRPLDYRIVEIKKKPIKNTYKTGWGGNKPKGHKIYFTIGNPCPVEQYLKQKEIEDKKNK